MSRLLGEEVKEYKTYPLRVYHEDVRFHPYLGNAREAYRGSAT